MAFSQPYTFTDLQTDLRAFEQLPNSAKYLKKEILCYTLLGNPCYLLTITSPGRGRDKRGVVFTGRVHPGETVSSWTIKGIVRFLLSDSLEARLLRENFVFKIIPMLNPDGVVSGNYRCSLAGCDLNRRYKNPSKALTPTVYYLKQMATEFSKTHPLMLYCDFHGHSKKRDVFLYGNAEDHRMEEYRMFPHVLAKVSRYVAFDKCSFGVQRDKTATARVVMWKELGLSAVYTVEASFLGPSREEGQHFAAADYMNMGASVCQGLFVYKNIFSERRIERFETRFLTKFIQSSANLNRVTEEVINDLRNRREILFSTLCL